MIKKILIAVILLWTCFVTQSYSDILIPKLPAGKRLKVFPLIFLPAESTISPTEKKEVEKRLWAHLKLATKHYTRILKTDTFQVSEPSLQVYQSENPNHYFTQLNAANAKKSAFFIMKELFVWLNENRYDSNRIYLVIYKRPDNRPYNWHYNLFGGGRPLNGMPNSGGGYVELEFSALLEDSPYPFQSTLVHELGHAFGMTHSDCLGYSMSESSSIMSYNLSHHSKGLKISSTPGGLDPEEFYVLSLNKRAFPDFEFIPSLHNPDNKALDHAQKCFMGPMSAEIGKFKPLPGVGYELFYNDRRVNGPEAAFYSFYQAEKNCAWNIKNRKQIKVGCRYNGTPFIPGGKPISRIDLSKEHPMLIGRLFETEVKLTQIVP